VLEIGDILYRTRGNSYDRTWWNREGEIRSRNDWSNFAVRLSFLTWVILPVEIRMPFASIRVYPRCVSNARDQYLPGRQPTVASIFQLGIWDCATTGNRTLAVQRICASSGICVFPAIVRLYFEAERECFYDQLPEVAVWRTAVYENLRQKRFVISKPTVS